MMRRGLPLAFITALTVLIASCQATQRQGDGDVTGAPPTPAPPAGPVGELTVALTTEPNSIYWPNTAERNASNVAAQMFEGPTWIDDDGLVQPLLAESWEVSEGGRVYTFHLREGVTFHDGTTMDAEDWVASWKAGSEESNAYAYQYQRVASVEAVDDMTVRMELPKPSALFPLELATWAIIPSEYYAEVGVKGLERHPIGTGPFRFVSWDRGDRIVLEAFDDYWQEGFPKVERLIFRPIPESSTRLAAVQTGEVDIAQRFSAEEAATLEQASDVGVLTYPVDRVYYIAFNNMTTGKGTPLEDVRVRQALNYAVDRQAIIDSILDGAAVLATGLISSSSVGQDPSIEPYPYDPDRARELLAEAGYPQGFEIGMACPTGAYTNFEEVCQAVAGYLEDVGVTLEGGEIRFMESGQYWDLEAKKELPPLFGDSWSSTLPESLERLRGAMLADRADFSAWEDPRAIDLIGQIGRTLDQEERIRLYQELHRHMYEDPPFIYLYEPFAFEGVNVRVHDYAPRGAEDYFLKGVWVDA
jgi:peptide/nickel transport system substrate-binding protein